MFSKKYLPNIHDFLPLKPKGKWAVLGGPKQPVDLKEVIRKLKTIDSKEDTSTLFDKDSFLSDT